MSKIYSVKDYGAKGDSTTNDFNAVVNTINAAKKNGGGTVYFPKGTYNITGNKLRLASGISFNGEGYESVLYRSDNEPTIFTTYIDKVANVKVSNLRLYSTASVSASEFKPIFDSLNSSFSNLVIDSCWFSSVSNVNNISLIMEAGEKSRDITVNNCTFEKCGRINFEIFTNKNKNNIMVENMTISNNSFYTTGLMCISAVTPTENLMVFNNKIVCNCPNTYGIGFEATPWMINATFEGNELSGNFGKGSICNINVVGTDISGFGDRINFSVKNNSFSCTRADDAALLLREFLNGSIENNVFNVTTALKFDGTANSRFFGNTVTSSARQGIIVRKNNGISISNNTLSTKKATDQIAVVDSSSVGNVLVKDNTLIKGPGGVFLKGNYLDVNNAKYDNVDPPVLKAPIIEFKKSVVTVPHGTTNYTVYIKNTNAVKSVVTMEVSAPHSSIYGSIKQTNYLDPESTNTIYLSITIPNSTPNGKYTITLKGEDSASKLSATALLYLTVV